MPFRLKDFAYYYSLQAGVVIISIIGMAIYTVAFLKIVHTGVFETIPKNTVYQYSISLVFIALGLAIYILGLTGSALEKSAVVRVGGSLLVVQIVFWIILMAISFTGECVYIRRVCVDNRCPERFYVQNGYWRKTVQECDKMDNSTKRNESEKTDEEESGDFVFVNNDEDLGQLVFEEPQVKSTELLDAPVTTNEDITEVVWQRTEPHTADKQISTVAATKSNKARTPTENKLAQNSTEKNQEQTANETSQEDKEIIPQDDGEKGSGERGSGESGSGENDGSGSGETMENAERKKHFHGVWTPIGDLKSNPHFVLSVVYVVMIILIWYLYPVVIFFSFATQLDLNER